MARKILLADDSVTAQNMGRKILTDAGYEVMTVNNGSAALKRVTEQRPDLIVLDVYMPGYSGLEVCQRLKDSRDTSRIPILLTVGKLEPFKPEDARRVSADAFIVKPFEASELLSALTRLEDRIVPDADGPRFSNTVSGIERFVTDAGVKSRQPGESGDTGWKSRIRFPSKKKAEEAEPEPDDFVNTPTFRDFRRGAVKPPAVAAPAITKSVEEPAPVRQEPGLVSDLPHDITPDELDALSALVAKLDGPVPEAEEIAPIGDNLGPAEPEHKGEVETAAPEVKAEFSTASTAEAVASSAVADAAPSVPAPESTAESEAVAASLEAVPAAEVEAPTSEMAAASAPETVVTPSEEPPAPVDQNDEPFFATAANAVQQTNAEEEEAVSERPEEVTQIENSEPVPPIHSSPAAEPEQQQPVAKVAEQETHRAKVEEMLAEAVAEEAVSEEVAEELQASEGHVPSDEELAEALRLLTPVHENGQAYATTGPQESVSGAIQPHSGNGSHWRAEAVALAPEELSISLEAEMFRSLAPTPRPDFPVEVTNNESATIASPAAAEFRAPALETSSESVSVMAVSAPEETGQASEPAITGQTPTSEALSQQQEPASATFASCPQDSDAENSPKTTGEIIQAEAHEQESAFGTNREDEDMGDEQSMAKTDHGKSSRSGWHQIRSAAPAAKADLVEAAKHSGDEPAEESPKAMAAAAASDESTSASTTDPNQIASIVDSVLADLRPRIVEEIAKKLGKK